ncbi:hypothetical protein H2O64_04430 [Kordia sp. YSTF-M3]|uniref:Uncharacterized protein n=1 Tax=Kordia aestuariivivens TaxID=2759037 RepID=A0ABR7Q6E2_9FLAO|nr:hypothetical protein [Kordia aestuariivivens]MBC8753904.1 hypothetical protein [Kordia aestuariivivens]
MKEKTKSVLKEGGKVVGESVGEFSKGLSEGVENTFKININTSENITKQGISFGKITLSSASGGSDNVLNVYMIFDRDFNDTLSLKVFDNNDLEMGRSSKVIEATKGEADFYEFQFSQKTNIDSDSSIFME